MPDLDSIVDVSISANTTTPQRPGFGIPMFLVYHTLSDDMVMTCTKSSDWTDAGGDADDAGYKMLAAAFRQSPRPKQVKIGRLTTAVVTRRELTVTNATEGDHITADILSPDGTETALDYTILGSATTTTVATAVESLIEAISGITSSSAAAVITAESATAGQVWYIKNLVGMTMKDVTPDASIDDDLDDILLEDTDWFGIASSIESETNVDDIASWAEENRRLFIGHSADDIELTGSGTIAAGWLASAYQFTTGIWSEDTDNYPACAWLGRMLPTNPGAATWIYKTLRGVTVSTLTPSEVTALEADRWSFYNTVGSRNVTQGAKVASGEWIDIIVGIEWLRSEVKLAVWDLLSATDKIPYTDAGVTVIKNAIHGVLQLGVNRGLLDAGDPDNGIDPPFVTAPKVADIPTADRANRLLPDVEFGARLAGAIHTTAIAGTLTV